MTFIPQRGRGRGGSAVSVSLDPSRRIAILVTAMVLLLGSSIFATPAEASTVAISGVAYQDMNRDGVQQPTEEPFVGHSIYVFDENGDRVASRKTDHDGRYTVSGLPGGVYRVTYVPREWRELREDWVPTTTGTLYPEHKVAVAGDAMTADFGWRPIVKSTDVNDPISDVTGPEGLRVQSYNDVIGAQEIYEHIASEFLVGDEATSTTVRFGYRTSGSASTGISYGYDDHGERIVTSVRTTVYAPYGGWLDHGDRTLAHEYGHAWMNYHNYYVQQDVDREWVAFLEARGIDPGDDRLRSSHAWSPGEIAAEDYRLLFASENAASSGHMNRDIPHPADVDGFEGWLHDQFTTPPDGGSEDTAGGDQGSEDGGAEDSDAGGSSSAEETEDPTTTSDDAVLELAVTVHKVRGVNHADLTWTVSDASNVDVYRNGQHITTMSGSTYTDHTGSRGSPTYTYRVCAAGSDVCSDEVEVTF